MSTKSLDKLGPLNSAQKEAVLATEGPVLIIAGPGSGKTRTLVSRVVYLISEKGVAPENILVSTFTEKAAKELITRTSDMLLGMDIRVNLNEMYMGTMHSIFLRILEENREFTRLSKNYRVLDQFDQNYFVYTHIKDFLQVDNIELIVGDKKRSNWQKSEVLVKYFSKLNEEVVSLGALEKSKHENIATLGKACRKYQELLKEANCLDFSTIQLEMLNLLESQPKLLKELRSKIQYLMIDEYQDTNTIQETIILRLLNPKTNNICVVGDEDQGLYRFRGATIRNILQFSNNFKKGCLKKIVLDATYRSHPDIIDFYNEWMEEIKWKEGKKSFRYDKEIKPQAGKFTKNPAVIKVSAEGYPEVWYKEVYSFIKALQAKKILTDLNQITFLFKSVKHHSAVGLAQYLESKGINIFSPRSAVFFEREEIQLLMGAFVFIFPNLFEQLKWNTTAYLKIWEYYRSCKDRFAEEIRKDKALHSELLKWCNKYAKKHISLSKNTNYSFSSLFYELLKYPLFSKYLDVDLNNEVTDLRAAYNLALFSKFLTKFEFLNNMDVFTVKKFDWILQSFFNRYLKFLKAGGIEEYEDFDEYAPSGSVSFMTIHQSKGLEFPIVVVDSLYARPTKQYTAIDEILENEFYHRGPFEPLEQTKYYDFWRLYYTAFSRAQNLLVLAGNEKPGAWKIPSKSFERLYHPLISWKSKKFDIKKLKLDKIKPVNIKQEYSFTSDILVYENCPLQYKFFKSLGFDPVRMAAGMFGVLVHQTIEDIHKTVLRKEEKKLSVENIENWFNRNYSSLSKSLRTYLGIGQKNAALKQVINYYKKHENDWDRIKEAEVDVSLVKDEYILRGKVDLIRGEKDTVEIIDFKSEKTKPNINSKEDRERLDVYRRQLEVYAHIIEERTAFKVSKMHLYYTGEESGNPYISYDRSSVDLDKTIKAFDTIVSEIEKNNFDNSAVKKCKRLCGNCDMRFYCDYK